MNDFVVAGRKDNVLAFTLVPAFFSLENYYAQTSVFLHSGKPLVSRIVLRYDTGGIAL
jgi:hypothetical protein